MYNAFYEITYGNLSLGEQILLSIDIQ